MPEIKLEYRIAVPHIGRGRIRPGVDAHTDNPYWSYARHLPEDWDISKDEKRRMVPGKLLRNLHSLGEDEEMDLSPLRDDIRVSGKIYGENPLQSMYNLITEMARRYPDYEFFGKWGGSKFHSEGKGFAFYPDNEEEAQVLLERILSVAESMQIQMDAKWKYGIKSYRQFVEIDQRLRSKVADRDGFRQELELMAFYPHFIHNLFLSNRHVEFPLSNH